MRAQLEQLGSLVEDLLEVSRITRGKLALRKAPVDLVDVVRSAVRTVEGDVYDRKQELVLALPASLCVEADATRLEQIVSNLLSNASKYTPEQGRIEVSGRRENAEVVIAVRDTGEGLEPEQLESIFQPFVQKDPLAGGLGIGLTLVRGLVELHGGSVEAGSDGPGRGSVFTVRLPAGEVGSATVTRGTQSVRRLPRRLRVLVVDDNRDFADSLSLLLERMGAEALATYTGADGLEKALSWHPEALLVDIALPDMKGYEVARQVRRSEGGEGPLLLAMTGFGNRESEEHASSAGFDARLLKPLDLEKLHGLLRSRSAKQTAPALPTRDRPPDAIRGAG
jgi:CheY-like chemotaxis protein/anti-sigma regulatory factor (Ser/Thr protein kinase)